MATAAMIVQGGFLEQKASEGLREAGLAIGFAQNANLLRLGIRLTRLNAVLKGLFEAVHAAAERPPAEGQEGDLPAEKLQSAIQSLTALHVLLEETWHRANAKQLTNCSRVGIALKLADLKAYSDRAWGLADWLGMVLNPAEYEGQMHAGRSEFDKGDFVRIA